MKWDGVRLLAGASGSTWRLWGRALSDYTPRYPELAALRAWPPGVVVDCEVVPPPTRGVSGISLLGDTELARPRVGACQGLIADLSRPMTIFSSCWLMKFFPPTLHV